MRYMQFVTTWCKRWCCLYNYNEIIPYSMKSSMSKLHFCLLQFILPNLYMKKVALFLYWEVGDIIIWVWRILENFHFNVEKAGIIIVGSSIWKQNLWIFLFYLLHMVFEFSPFHHLPSQTLYIFYPSKIIVAVVEKKT